jgi:hypothetical protein
MERKCCWEEEEGEARDFNYTSCEVPRRKNCGIRDIHYALEKQFHVERHIESNHPKFHIEKQLHQLLPRFDQEQLHRRYHICMEHRK